MNIFQVINIFLGVSDVTLDFEFDGGVMDVIQNKNFLKAAKGANYGQHNTPKTCCASRPSHE